MNIRLFSRFIYLIGSMMGLISLFFAYYRFFSIDLFNECVVYWSYNLLSGWKTQSSIRSALNSLYYPESLGSFSILNYIYLISSSMNNFFSLISFEESRRIQIKNKVMTILFFVQISLLIYYLFIFPILSLIPNSLYIPILNVEAGNSKLAFYYSFDLGYYLLLISFIMILTGKLFFYAPISLMFSKNYHRYHYDYRSICVDDLNQKKAKQVFFDKVKVSQNFYDQYFNSGCFPQNFIKNRLINGD